MTTTAFIELVREMRKWQRAYNEHENMLDGSEARHYEKRVDAALMDGLDDPVFVLVEYRTTNGVYVDGKYVEMMQFNNIMEVETDNIKSKAKHHSALPNYRGAGIIIDKIEVLNGGQ